jgi:hypothetical protein
MDSRFFSIIVLQAKHNGIFLTSFSMLARIVLLLMEISLFWTMPLHGGLASLDLLLEILDTFGVTLVYLPAYSPELNPCKLVFGMTKAEI